MKSKVTIAIVGATSTGCATAGALAASGWPDILVMDRQKLPGTVSYPDVDPGFVFAPLTAHADLSLLQESDLVYRDLSFRGERAFDRVGSLTLASTEAGMTALTAQAATLSRVGIEAVILSPGETAMRLPILDSSKVAGSLWVSSDGIMRPHVVRAGLIERARDTLLPWPDPAADAQVTFRGNIHVDTVERGTRGWTLDSNRGALDARFTVWTAGHAPKSLQRRDPSADFEPQAQYVETAPLPALKWLADTEIALPAVHHWESGLSLRQRHGCLGILGTALHSSRGGHSSQAGHSSRNGRQQAQALIAAAAALFPDLANAVVSTSSLVAAIKQFQRQCALTDTVCPISDTGIVCPPVPCALAVGLGRRIARELAGDSRHHLDHRGPFVHPSAPPSSQPWRPIRSATASDWAASGADPWATDADAFARDAQPGITLH